MIPDAFDGPEAHYLRADVDHHVAKVAQRYGAEAPRGDAHRGHLVPRRLGVDVTTSTGERFEAKYIVDGTGFRSILANQFDLREKPTRFKTHSRSVFTHMTGVKRYEDVAPETMGPSAPAGRRAPCITASMAGGSGSSPSTTGPTATRTTRTPASASSSTRGSTPSTRRSRRSKSSTRCSTATRACGTSSRTPRRSGSGSRPAHGCSTQASARSATASASRRTRRASSTRSTRAGWRSRRARCSADRPRALSPPSRTTTSRRARFEGYDQVVQRSLDRIDDLVSGSYTAWRSFDLWNAWVRVWYASVNLSTLHISATHKRFQAGASRDALLREMYQPQVGSYCRLSTPSRTSSPRPSV